MFGWRINKRSTRADEPACRKEGALLGAQALRRKPLLRDRLEHPARRKRDRRSLRETLRDLFRSPDTLPVLDEDELRTLLSLCGEDRGMRRRLKKGRATARDMARFICSLEGPQQEDRDRRELLRKLRLFKARLELERACRSRGPH